MKTKGDGEGLEVAEFHGKKKKKEAFRSVLITKLFVAYSNKIYLCLLKHTF